MRSRLLLSLVASLALALGCTDRPYSPGPGRHGSPPDHAPAHGVRHGGGPPPHAPAHGYRAKARGRDLQFDSRRSVYVVVGTSGLYWSAGWFYRLTRDRWQRCGDGDGPWHDARWGDVPVGLRGGPSKGKGKWRAKGHR